MIKTTGALGAAVALGPLLTGCTGSTSAGDQAAERTLTTGEVQWWDHFRATGNLFAASLFSPYEKDHPGVTVARRQMQTANLAQAVQLARRNNAAPDVHDLGGLNTAEAVLVANGWFDAVSDFSDVSAVPAATYVLDGLTRFDGKTYTLPVFNSRWHQATPWVNTQQLQRAGLDPDASPKTWDAFRAAMRAIQAKASSGSHALVVPTKAAYYLEPLIGSLAMAAGGPGPVDPRSGAYTYTSTAYADAMEFLLALQRDKVVHPASAAMDDRDARSRWAAGEATVYPWGPWFIGGLQVEDPAAVKRGVAAWTLPSPDGHSPVVYTAPPGGTFWLSNQSHRPKIAAELIAKMGTEDFQIALAAVMDQPPVLIDLVDKAKVHPAYRANIATMKKQVFFGPQPQVRNAAASDVLAEMRAIHPNVGEITQAVLTGADTDYRNALQHYQDQLTAERERAITVVVGKGKQVGLADWVFADYTPGRDHVY